MSNDPPPTDSLTTAISSGTRALHLALLVGIGIAQPLYDLLGRNPSFFVAHSATAIDLILLVTLVSIALPAVLWLVQWVMTRIAGNAGLVVFLAVVAAFFTIIAVVPVKRLFPAAGAVALAVAITIGLVATIAYCKLPALRSVMSLLSPCVLVFPVLFLFFSGATEIMGAGADIPTEMTGVTSTTSVVLIVLDELPVTSLMNEQRGIDSVVFPNFAELAAHSHWFRNATTVAQSTSYAVPAILTGRYPDASRAPHAAAYPENLFTFLAGSHELRAFEIFTRLCPDEINAALVEREPLEQRLKAVVVDSSVVYLHIVLPSKLTAELPAIDATWRDFGRESDDKQAEDPHAHTHDSTWVAERFTQSLTSARRPALFFVHLNLPHLPWKYLPSGREYMLEGGPLRPHGLLGEMWDTEDWEVIQGWQRHLLQTGYADRLLGHFIKRLHLTGLWDDALIIVTADHGASFQPGRSRRETTEETAADILGIPLFIKLPGQDDPQVLERTARTIDIFATIADVLDADLPWAIDGRSLFAHPATESGTVVIYRNQGTQLRDHLELPYLPEAKYRALERKLEIFGAGTPIDDLYSIGEFGRLVGRSTSDFDTAAGVQISVVLDDAWLFESVDLDGPFLPAQITGRLIARASFDHPIDLAVAVNGTIQATTMTYSLPGEDEFSSFSAMVSDAAMTSGRNLVMISLIEENGDGDPRLRSILPAVTIAYSLRQDENGEISAILGSDGSTITLKPGAIRGEYSHKQETFTGMAANVTAGRPAESIFVFAGSQFLFSTDVWMPTPSITKRYGDPRLSKTGFRFMVPAEFLDNQTEPLRFFAVIDSTATDISQPPE